MSRFIFLIFSITFWGICCHPKSFKHDLNGIQINLSHLNSLFDLVSVEGKDSVGVIYIYSEYPDYQWIGDSDEGIACIDDAARACIFYLRNYHYTGNTESRQKAEDLIRFILVMQSKNGYFNNFIFADLTINRDGITSQAQPNWWSWRAYWALAEASKILDESHPLHNRITKSKKLLTDRLVKDFASLDKKMEEIEGLQIPQWLPDNSASDQAALVLLGLSINYQDRVPSEIQEIMGRMKEGILKMQIQTKGFPNKAFLSWQNIWHGYGNSQSYALLIHALTGQQQEAKAAIQELDEFHPQWIERMGISNFRVRKNADEINVHELHQFPQIAYDLRPMIWANLAAHEFSGEQKYYHQAMELGLWFLAVNPLKEEMYDPKSGRGYDGILEDMKNKNAGAESTIEALLSMQELKYLKSETKLPWLK